MLQGKQDQWSHAHAKTQEASKHANASELAACKAQEKYSSMTEAQRNADNARRRQQEVRLSCTLTDILHSKDVLPCLVRYEGHCGILHRRCGVNVVWLCQTLSLMFVCVHGHGFQLQCYTCNATTENTLYVLGLRLHLS